MKKISLLFIFVLITLSLHAQKSETKRTEQISESEFYYAVNGKKFKTRKGRDRHEQKLEEDLNIAIAYLSADENVSKSLIEEYSDNSETVFRFSRAVNSLNNIIFGILIDDELSNIFLKGNPRLDFSVYTARNNELCYTPEMRDLLDAVIGIYEIVNGAVEIATKDSKDNLRKRKVKPGGVSGNVTIIISLHDLKDSKGNTYDSLLYKLKKSNDKILDLNNKILSIIEQYKHTNDNQ